MLSTIRRVNRTQLRNAILTETVELDISSHAHIEGYKDGLTEQYMQRAVLEGAVIADYLDRGRKLLLRSRRHGLASKL
ncbi:MAG: hypothetical protein AUJ92_09595 [Armatimonadetes bacterium CG2_30_59_28]|nr:hypothetical protein [Armatimonadota bacterium]OIO94664.1 MAG: hypothetical protein AUJ92_09595 [Armatimonadetes bacterium CG2_30_59_28]PIU67302.1 MAG: hypothetical protein COS85_01145 [Armatimonadetes bacterium CG07_land_8_20_14_0_80_59_28]PIX37974.1 MAG: hypothetical protein COZ56_21725 [Armatimonadetes bacterium CG_4_8_14_3_um_filter_58_9]PIY49106.1 MAG: hypothetical protein COZ05_01270 [Armatimonadetes bacterium CG_4_10_14_3_um_filter_59_10]